MDNVVSRAELTPVDRSVVRAPSSAAAVQPVAASRANDALTRDGRRGAEPPQQPDAAQELASVAEYVEVHARIAEILADLSAGRADVQGAADAVDALIPRPIVIVPLPPASKEAVEHAAAVAKRIVERAAYAHGAQAHLARGTVEQIVASASGAAAG
ncbi:MAG: hypothetical protein WBL20_03805 [Sphingobium sp.]|uniref:hypothetical protein n=1 Tax=Sphingobium sp. TaxID=1912891 RepID=UPI002E1EA9F1